MTFSPDASFPVINIEKGSLHGQFTAEFERARPFPEWYPLRAAPSQRGPLKAEALFEGLDGSDTEAFAHTLEAELGIRFDVTSEGGYMKIEAFGGKRPCFHPLEGEKCPDRTSFTDRKAGAG